MFWGIIFIAINVVTLGKVVYRLCNTVLGYLELRKISAGSSSGVKLCNILYSEKKYTLLFCMCALAIVGTGYCCYLTIHYFPIIYFIVGFVLSAISSVLDLIIFIMIYLYKDYAYLTTKGIVAIEGIYKKEKYRFVIEAELSKGENAPRFINVYKDKGECPYRFKILEQEEKVEQIINGFHGILVFKDETIDNIDFL